MNFFITAGNTQTMIDRVRCVTNIFSGRTGASVARTAWGRGHTVTLATSHPDTLSEFGFTSRGPGERFTVLPYNTFDDLAAMMQNQFRAGPFDAVCHSAAVSDYLPAGTFTPDSGTFFNARTNQWEARGLGSRLSPSRRPGRSRVTNLSCGCASYARRSSWTASVSRGVSPASW